MRYNKAVTFWTIQGEAYNPKTGRHEPKPPEERLVFCHVSDLTADRVSELMGSYNKRAILIHHRGRLLDVTECEVDGVTYKVLQRRAMRNEASYICEAVRL